MYLAFIAILSLGEISKNLSKNRASRKTAESRTERKTGRRISSVRLGPLSSFYAYRSMTAVKKQASLWALNFAEVLERALPALDDGFLTWQHQFAKAPAMGIVNEAPSRRRAKPFGMCRKTHP